MSCSVFQSFVDKVLGNTNISANEFLLCKILMLKKVDSGISSNSKEIRNILVIKLFLK